MKHNRSDHSPDVLAHYGDQDLCPVCLAYQVTELQSERVYAYEKIASLESALKLKEAEAAAMIEAIKRKRILFFSNKTILMYDRDLAIRERLREEILYEIKEISTPDSPRMASRSARERRK